MKTVSFKLTQDDILRYEQKIAAIDISIQNHLIDKVSDKIENLLNKTAMTALQAELLRDVSRLVMILKNVPDLDITSRRKIIFALQYFYDPDDEIPDSVSVLGFLDDAIVVKWIVDQVLVEYPEYFQA